MRTRLGYIAVVGILVMTAVPQGVFAHQEVELQAATDSLQAAGYDTVERVFWRSGFGASVIGGPTVGGNASAYSTRQGAIEALTGGTTPVGAYPVFLEFSALANASYASGLVNASDYATQRWNFTPSARMTGAGTLGAGAAANARLAGWLLRTNHHANGTEDPAAPLVGATASDGLLGLWMVDALIERVNAVLMYGAFNGSALTAFNLTDPALNDADGSNGWQLVPDGLSVSLSSDPEPLFQGFAPLDNATGLLGTAYMILGLAEIVALSDPAGAHAGLFDGDPFDASLHNNSQALLASVVANSDAAHWDATAMTYASGSGAQDTAALAVLAKALAEAEGAVDSSQKANMTAARARALAALTSLADAFGVFPSTYDIAGPSVTGNFSTVTLWAQSAALEATAAAYGATGLAAHLDGMMRASAGLESALFSQDSYHAVRPEPTFSTFSSAAIGQTVGGLRDLALTGDAPLAIYRVINATQWLFSAPPLVLGGATHPPVIGASFVWDAGNESYVAASNSFSAWESLTAAYEFLTTGPEFYAAVGGGVQTTLRASLLLHNATAEQVGASIDAIDAQVQALQGQLAALQATFDALSANVTATTDRLNLSLENETISADRIAGLQANLTALRAQLNYAEENLTTVRALFDNETTRYSDLQKMYNESSVNLTLALNNATGLAGQLNLSIEQAEDARRAMETTNATRDAQARELSYAQGVVAIAAFGGIIAGVFLLMFLQKFVMAPKSEAPKDDAPKKGASKKTEEEPDDDGEDESDN